MRFKQLRAFATLATTSVVVLLACGSGSGGPGGGSAICRANGTNACAGAAPICNGDLGCVECNDDSDCPATSPRCIEGRCHACAANSDCGIATPWCWADFTCHAACTTNANCPPDLSMCESGSGACLQCQSNQ